MNALVISPQPFFSPRGTPLSVYYRTLIISELGVNVDLLTYGEGQDVDIPGVRIIRIPSFKILGNVKVGPSILKCFLDVFLVIWTIALLIQRRYDFVHAHEEAIFFCIFLKPIFNFKLVYDMHSSLPQQLINFQFTKSKLIISLFKWLEDLCLRSTDVIITICPDLYDYVSQLVRDREKHFMIENSIFDPVKLLSRTSSPIRPDYHIIKISKKLHKLYQKKRLVVYAGTLEHYQGIDILIESFKRVVTEISDAFLIIIGGTDRQVAYYSNYVEKLGLDECIIFTGHVSQLFAKEFCGLASVLVSPRSKGTNTPLKIYEQLASGIPLVATNIYSHTQVLNENVVILVEPEPKDMAKGISTALNSEGFARQFTENARSLYEQKYSRPVYEQKINQVLEILAN